MIADYLTRTGLSKAEFARRVGVTPAMVWQWINGHRPIAAERVIPIELATGGELSRHDLRPDLYPRDGQAA